MSFDIRRAMLALACVVLMSASPVADAEPYIALQEGLKCSACHVSPSGGGKRTAYGNAYAQAKLAAHAIDFGNSWTGDISRYLAVGGDARGGWTRLDVPGQDSNSDSDLEEILGYVEVRAIPDRLSLYVDAKLAPDDPVIREQYARLSWNQGRWAVRAGEFFLPYGLRLQDDDAFIRQASGINFNTPDRGWELGFEQGRWSAQFAVTRGTAGGPEIDSGKQYSLRVERIRENWRIGGSFNLNDARLGDRRMQNLFGGIRTGPVAWLAEIDYIIDAGTPTGRRASWASILEANYGFRAGHNAKFTYEWFDPDDDVSEDEQTRFGIVWEYTPIRFLQVRAGFHKYDGIPQNPAQNRSNWFAELHIPF